MKIGKLLKAAAVLALLTSLPVGMAIATLNFLTLGSIVGAGLFFGGLTSFFVGRCFD